MKNILFVFLLISTVLFSQQNDKKWDNVIALENQGKVKAANEIVSKIYKKAVNQKDEVQMIKCFFYQSKYLQVVDENAQTKILNNLQTDINRASIPSKAILNVVYAKCLTDYYSNNRYQINIRTNTTVLDSDFLTWTDSNFISQINLVLKNSLENEAILKNTSLIKYEVVFDYPTLEKFKTLNVFNYILSENISIITKKLRTWEIKKSEFFDFKKELLGNSNDFIKLNFDSVSNENLKIILKLYQKQEINNPSVENIWQRIQFSKNYIVDADEDYIKALTAFQKQTNDVNLIHNIQLEKAYYLAQHASKHTYPDYNVKAVATLDSILKTENKSNAYKLALQKKEAILHKFLNVKLQKYIYNNENTRGYIRYQNIENLKISFFKISQAQIKQTKTYKRDSIIENLVTKTKPTASQIYPLVDKKDYYEYSTEVLLPKLEIGSYLVYFESESDTKGKKATAFETITVSQFIVLASQNEKQENYQVLDRKTGKPLENITVKTPSFSVITNKNGNAILNKVKDGYNELISFYTSNDTLSVNKNYLYYNTEYDDLNNKDQKFSATVEFYLDRAIYRPGQTVYYKGIAVQRLKNKVSVVPYTSFKVTVEDANQNHFKEFDVTSNEFGSFSGEFILPKTGLTGTFTIKAEEPDDYEKDNAYDKTKNEHPFWDNVNLSYSELGFRVEEYKRPKFEVNFEPKKGSFELNKLAKVNGTAKAFAGSNISDAKVTYTVTRSTNYFRDYYSQEPNEVLKTGETKTDASGKFTIDFTALPSENAIKEKLPVFSYLIKASVTDINGETHDAQTTIKVGYHDLELNTIVKTLISTKNKNDIKLTSTNLNGESKTVKGDVKIYFLNPISTKFKTRVFPNPDIEAISDAEFEKLFPYESNIKLKDKTPEILVFTKKIDTETDKTLPLDFIINYKSGNYKVVFSAQDSFGNLIENSSTFKIKQSKDKFDASRLFTAEQINSDAKKDGFALIKLTSVIPDLYIIGTANFEGNIFSEETYHLENHETVIRIPLKKEFKDIVTINFENVFENEKFDNSISVALKSEKPELKFDVDTFRSKLQPGSSENWSFKLTGTATKKEAEVLASMYDASLDQFATKNWERWNSYYNSGSIVHGTTKSVLGNEKTNTIISYPNSTSKSIELKNESTKLIWFGFDFNSSNYNALYLQREYQRQLSKKVKKPANAKMISGIVTDNNKLELPGVSVTVKGTQRSTTTDYDGYYEIEANENEELVFSYIGFKSETVVISQNKIQNIILKDESSNLEEVVVVGYGVQKKKSLTGAVTQMVVQEDNTVYNTAGISDSLSGKVAGVSVSDYKVMIRGNGSISSANSPIYVVDGIIVANIDSIDPKDILAIDVLKDQKATALYGSRAANGAIIITTKKALEGLTQVKARKNLSETAFFFPNLRTDSKGKVSFNFTSPEALTAWKLRLLAHNKDAVVGYLEKNVVTQKELMVLPNFPRFLREKDTIVISTKISNVTNETKTGIASLQFFDASTMQPIDAKMLNAKNIKNFTIPAYGNTTANWTITIPEGLQGIQYKIVAKAGNFSDGEENIIPVLTNNMLVTESIPIWVRENSTKEYTFENLKNNNSTTLKNHQFTLEYTSNPTWLAIQSIPYLMEYEHECAEQTFARFYANSLATEIIASNPKIASIFEEWRKNEKLNSKLDDNEELKSLILAETPWLNDAQNENEKKRNLALLFDLEKMKTSQDAAFQKLKQKQLPSGAFSWFGGNYENEYITRHILAGLGHLEKLQKNNTTSQLEQITATAIPFIDSKFLEYYKATTKNLKKSDKLIWLNPYSDLHYLYTRSFYLEKYPLPDTLKKASKLYIETAKKSWLNYSLYEKGLAALTLNRFGEKATAKTILESLKETASNNEDWGMYWIANKSGWYWYQAPIETQALLIEAFAEINNDTKSVDAMKVWLLKNKQTKNWPTTKSTTEAIYALLMQGTDWLSVKDNTVIKLGDEKIMTKKLSENEKEAETGYIKLNWKADEVKKEMASIKIENKSKVPGFGGVYWQYFEDLDKIKNNSSAILSVSKELYLKKSTLKGNQLEKITTKNPLKIGDLVTVRLIITSKEDTEYVHLKDMRASCFEPVNVLSEYQYKNGLGYYMSTKDAATHLFFDQIKKGTYVLEYDIRVNNIGEFSNGITTIQSMYAPEFASHTKGIRVKVQ
ncbi:alpha-2-macroglobulin family protein [Flavobacterium phragmitis]|uniref:TonB-dependent outer membrane receptor, SusC/RagA subfamily, signature region n=1 Tax=Flavobacterium phragmitis TaxID=739143 RepID=A0A1I1UWU2_9FLAO|nr:carboxypeptidase-like regulatory domain-containing protein [Flavobacterium phragmitis]SFD75246.1 TonB-dependent outer membrane receptor, SusC/RagA subfamily, signature region [Flavobacterium phragmitis]